MPQMAVREFAMEGITGAATASGTASLAAADPPELRRISNYS